MFRRLAGTAAALTLLISPAALAATPAEDAAFRRDADAFIDRALREIDVTPGLAVAFVDGDRTVYVRGTGLADTAPAKPADADTRFYIASSTKSFTALAIAALAARGEVNLDAPVATWLPDSGLPPAIAARVTLRQLLTHTSGLDNSPISFRAAFSGDHTPEVMQSLLAATVETPDAPVGTFRYSNAGYNIATLLIARKTGLDWRALVKREVLDPLGMTATTPFISRAGGVLAAGHVAGPDGGLLRSALQKSDATMQSAGGLVSTANDMARWLQVQINDGVVDGRRVFPAGLVASTHRPLATQDAAFGPYRRTGYGLGWEVGSFGDDLLVHHFGNFAGSRAHVSLLPAHRLGVAVMVNEDVVAGGLADLVANYLYERRLNRPDVEARYAAALGTLKADRDTRRTRIAEGTARFAARPRMLTLPDGAYAGRYENPLYGAFDVTATDVGLVVTMGPMRAVAQAFTQPESIRVELVPGQGQAIVFRLDEAGRVVGARAMGADFTHR
jgi:CubicO group peptidase (beta-lactamase class C family)